MHPPPLPGEATVDATGGPRLDVFLLDHLPGESRSTLQRWIESGHVQVNDRPARPGHRLSPGDRVAWSPPDTAGPVGAPEGEALPLNVVYEDDSLLVIDKPAGMVVHPSPGHAGGTIVNAVLARGEELSDLGGPDRPGIVHRLDRDTSGLMVVARSNEAHRALQQQIQERTAERRYVAVLLGCPRFEFARVDAPIGRHPRRRQRMTVLPPGSPHPHREAVTEIRVLEQFPGFSLVECRLGTGRTHQIRVHCAYIHFPVVGDPLYGAGLPGKGAPLAAEVRLALQGLRGQALHAYRLSFDHPATGRRMQFLAPPPADFEALLRALGSRWEAKEEDPWRDIVTA